MASPVLCPDATTLQRLVLGQLDPDEITTLQEHLADCPTCLAVIDTLSADDPLVRAARSSAGRGGTEDEAVDRLMERLRGLGPTSAGPGSTVTYQRGAMDTPAEGISDTYDFLLGPGAAGELGRLGRYRVRRVLGTGGMGIVFEAEDPQLQRTVALKVMRPTMATRPDAGERFLKEARAAAAIQHDHIVTIHEADEDQGVPYLAMQLLHGETLESRLQRLGRRPAAEVVRLGRQIARGLAAAHARGLIHRDVKPSNIWIERPGDGAAASGPAERVKLLDFGLAQAAAEMAHTSHPGLLAGTPAYMAPEQAADGPIDHRCDLFSLGCVLYRMCTGEVPFKGEKPLTVLWALAVQDPVPPRQLNPEVPRELSDVILRLLAKDPAGRPQSAREVADALAAIDVSEPAAPARRPRRRGIWAAAAVAAALLVAVVAYFYGGAAYRLATNRGQVAIETDDPDAQVVLSREGKPVVTLGANEPPVTLEADTYQVQLANAKVGQRLWTTEVSLRRGEKQMVRVGWEPPGLFRTLVGHTESVFAAAFCLGGTHVVSAGGGLPGQDLKARAGSDFALRLWDARTGREELRLRDHAAVVLCLAVSPDGRYAVSAGGHESANVKRDPRLFKPDYALRLWDLQGRRLVRRFLPRHTDIVHRVAFAADGQHVVSASADGSVRLWDIRTGDEVRSLEAGRPFEAMSVDISADGGQILSGHQNGVMRLWTAETGKPSTSFNLGPWRLFSAALLPLGRGALSAKGDGTVVRFDLQTSAITHTYRGAVGAVYSLAVSPDGRRLLAGGNDTRIRLWDVDSEQPLGQYEGHQERVWSVAFSPDGRVAVSAGHDRTVRLWVLPE